MSARALASAPARPLHATAVKGGIVQRKCACGGLGGECEACRREREGLLQRSATDAPLVVHDVLRSAGRPLDPHTRALMESRFGGQFGHVRVHTDPRAAESARAVNAPAYTVGQDVVFGAGQYAPAAPAGRRLLAHELAHVVQQSGLVADPPARIPSDAHDSREAEAERAAAVVADPRPQSRETESAPQVRGRTSRLLVQRQAAAAQPPPEEATRPVPRDPCGEWDDSQLVFVVEGKKLDPSTGKPLVVPDTALGAPISTNWEIRYMRQGVCEYIVLRAKEGEQKRTIVPGAQWEFTTIRADVRGIRNLRTGQARLGGQISSEGKIKLLREGTGLPLDVSLNLVIGSNIDPVEAPSPNLLRLRPFMTVRGDAEVPLRTGKVILRIPFFRCQFADAELGQRPRWTFTLENCIKALRRNLVENLAKARLEVELPKTVSTPWGIPGGTPWGIPPRLQ